MEPLPGLALLRSENGGLFQQGAHTVAADFSGRMKPAKEPHPAKAFGQDVLEKTADEFRGFQSHGLALARVGVAVGPEDPAGRQLLQLPVAGSGLEDVTGQVGQSVFAGPDRLSIHHPGLFPDLGGQRAEGFGRSFLQSGARRGPSRSGSCGPD